MYRIFLFAFPCISAFAGTIGTYTFTGTASGTLDGTPFTGDTLTISAPGDFSTVFCGTGFCSLSFAPGDVSYSIGGVGSGTISDSTDFFDNQTSVFFGTPAGLVGFTDGDDVIQMYGALIGTSDFVTYNLQSAIGPLGPQASDPSTSDWLDMNTTGGVLAVTSFTDFTFQVTVSGVPEPCSLLLSGIGLAGLAFAKLRPRR